MRDDGIMACNLHGLTILNPRKPCSLHPLTHLESFYMHLAAASEPCSSFPIPLAPASQKRKALGGVDQSLAQVALSM